MYGSSASTEFMVTKYGSSTTVDSISITNGDTGRFHIEVAPDKSSFSAYPVDSNQTSGIAKENEVVKGTSKYWTSTVSTDMTGYREAKGIKPSVVDIWQSSEKRCYGCPIRGVHP